MDLTTGIGAVASASGDDPVDWAAVTTAAKSVTPHGELDLTPAEEAGYASDVRDARRLVGSMAGFDVSVPSTVEVQNRHHWIDANAETFRRAFEPLRGQVEAVHGLSRRINTATTAGTLAYIARHVLGQYDPVLLGDDDEHGLYFVHPNVVQAADDMDVEYERFRRWIAFHEVAHAAEFGAAPWLREHLSDLLTELMASLPQPGDADEALRELTATMAAVEGYAELLMDHAFDRRTDDLREKLDARRGGMGPITWILRRLLGYHTKRDQYERGRAFFDTIAGSRGIDGAARVWEAPSTLPTQAELERPTLWLARVEEGTIE